MLKPSKFPVRIWIEPTNYCNLKCRFCPHKDMQRPIGSMSLTHFKRLADEIAENPIEELWMQNCGESTLNPYLIQMINYAANKGICPIWLSVNCTTLSPIYAEHLLLSGLNFLMLSLDGATKNTYELFRPGANYKRVVENIKRIFKMKEELKLSSPVLVLQIIYSDETQDEIHAYIEQWAPYLNKDDKISLKEYNDFAGRVEIKTPKKKDFSLLPCSVLFKNLVVFWNGRVTPCCMDIEGELTVGNVFESSISEVWNNNNFKNIRKAVNNRAYEELAVCRNCSAGIGKAISTFNPKG